MDNLVVIGNSRLVSKMTDILMRDFEKNYSCMIDDMEIYLIESEEDELMRRIIKGYGIDKEEAKRVAYYSRVIECMQKEISILIGGREDGNKEWDS